MYTVGVGPFISIIERFVNLYFNQTQQINDVLFEMFMLFHTAVSFSNLDFSSCFLAGSLQKKKKKLDKNVREINR